MAVYLTIFSLTISLTLFSGSNYLQTIDLTVCIEFSEKWSISVVCWLFKEG